MLEDQVEWLRQQNSHCETNLAALSEENAKLEKFVAENEGKSTDLNVDNLDTLVYANDPFSAK